MSKFEKFYSYSSMLLLVYIPAAWITIAIIYDGWSIVSVFITFVIPAIILIYIYGFMGLIILFRKKIKHEVIHFKFKIMAILMVVFTTLLTVIEVGPASFRLLASLIKHALHLE